MEGKREGWKAGRCQKGLVKQRKGNSDSQGTMLLEIPSMEESLNSLNFFIVEQQKSEDLFCKKNRLTACCLTILIF